MNSVIFISLNTPLTKTLMIKHSLTCTILFAVVSLLMTDCKKNDPIETPCSQFYPLFNDSTSYQVELPEHIISAVRSGGYYDETLDLIDLPSNSTVESFIDHKKAKLGRILFYDTQLSLDNTISCGTCHVQQLSFTEDRATSQGIGGQIGSRNSMNLENVIFYPSSGGYGWGEGSAILEEQIKAAILNPIEMDMTENQLIENIENNCYYEGPFIAAYGDFDVSTNEVYEALTHFIGSMTSYNSPYDVGRAEAGNANATFGTFTPLENAGKQLFIGSCASCHSLEIFKGSAPTNIGLDEQYADNGLGNETGSPDDDGKFKTPSLRNVMVTAPYMHDGRFETLDEVLAFYNDSIQAHPNLDARLKDSMGDPKKFEFEDYELEQLKAFLGTLTDQSFLNEEKYSDPFK